MRPHLLELEAFMAFPGRVALDLDQLSEGGLLLLCGDTGGGKTTLLDALGFALYGRVPGERAKTLDDLRSHHAVPTARAWVRLEFTARGRRLRITRTPAQTRPKLRGEGVVHEHPTAVLEERSGDGWAPLAARNEDVGLEVERLLGMTFSQFFQVVVLPQGRFADFLQADHKQRETLLKKLFHVDRFEHVERWLGDRSAAAARALEEGQHQLDVVAAKVAQAAAVERPELIEDDPGWAAALAAAVAARHRDLAAATAVRRAVHAETQARAQAETRLAEQQEHRRQLERTRAALVARQPESALLAAELTAARSVQPVVEAAAVASAGSARAAAASSVAEAAVAELGAVTAGAAGELLVQAAGGADVTELGAAALTELGAPALTELGAPALRALGGAARERSGRLSALTEVERRAAAAEQAAQQAQVHEQELTWQLVAVTERAGALPAVREQARAALVTARAAHDRVPGLRAEQAALVAHTELVAELQELDAARPGLAGALAEAVDAADAARVALRDLRNRRIDAISAELAAALVEGTECPVCGSLEHPAVAEVQAESVSKGEERAAEQHELAARTAVGAAERRLVAHDAGRAARAAASGQAPPAGRLAEVTAELAELERCAAGLPEHERRDLELAGDDQELATASARLTAEASAAAARLAEQAALAAELRAQVLSEIGPGAGLAARVAELSALVSAAERAAEAVELADRRSAEAEAAHDAVASLLAGTAFPALDAALAAARPAQWHDQASAALERHARDLDLVEAQLAAPEGAVPLDPAADPETWQARLVEAAQALEAGVSEEHLAGAVLQQLTALVPDYEEVCRQLPELREAAAQLRALSEVASGRGANRLQMPLSTFVLAARLEEVAAAASQRLARMTDGRYTLVHSDVGRDKRSRAGLGLRVEDAWTGRSRDTASLSGGETFKTALSLALGLADVVTAEAGGQSIDALFVDEGFGTLDARSLDQVMDVLDDLRSGGRLVGVVSHVADLRQRIPTQVHVRLGQHGSTLGPTTEAA